jgi:RNA-directed DNA polymerase
LTGGAQASGQANVQSNNYWSSTTNANNTDNAWVVNMDNGNVNNNHKSNNNYVWPVRAGECAPPPFSFEALYASYRKCRRNKRRTINALKFEIDAEENLFNLEQELLSRTYRPSRSVCFVVEKPKMREIVAADFRDRVVHHLLVEQLEAVFEPVFIHDSYACRKEKGLHKAVTRVREFIRRAGSNGRKPLYFAHLDIHNYFMSIDKGILFELVRKKVLDESLLWLAWVIISHDPVQNCVVKGQMSLFELLPPHKSLFHAPKGKGLPVGNLTSQFFANVYLNQLDQFVKHTLKWRWYVRYSDDFLLLGDSIQGLEEARERIREFLAGCLDLCLNDRYNRVERVSNGIDFLGYIIRPDYVLVRRRVVNNMRTRLDQIEKRLVSIKNGFQRLRFDYEAVERLRGVVASYFGHLKWADTHRLRLRTLERYGFLKSFFSFENGRIRPLYRFCQVFPRVKSQYLYYANCFKGMVVFMQVGRFYEFYSRISPAIRILDLKPLKANRRGARFGFPVHLGDAFGDKVAEQGFPVVIVRETGQYVCRIKERLPVEKITVVTASR